MRDINETATEVVQHVVEITTARGGIETFESLAARYEFCIRKAAEGHNYFTGFHDAGDPAKPFGLSYAVVDWVKGTDVHVVDLEALIH